MKMNTLAPVATLTLLNLNFEPRYIALIPGVALFHYGTVRFLRKNKRDIFTICVIGSMNTLIQLQPLICSQEGSYKSRIIYILAPLYCIFNSVMIWGALKWMWNIPWILLALSTYSTYRGNQYIQQYPNTVRNLISTAKICFIGQ